jgi:hypothetical protein
VQHTKTYKGWCYRLVAYDDTRAYVPVDFDAIGDLAQTIRRVIPDFGESSLAVKADADYSYVAFSTDCELDEGQLFRLGLHPNS